MVSPKYHGGDLAASEGIRICSPSVCFATEPFCCIFVGSFAFPFLGCDAVKTAEALARQAAPPFPRPPSRPANQLLGRPFQDQFLAVAQAALVTSPLSLSVQHCLPARNPKQFPPSQPAGSPSNTARQHPPTPNLAIDLATNAQRTTPQNLAKAPRDRPIFSFPPSRAPFYLFFLRLSRSLSLSISRRCRGFK